MDNRNIYLFERFELNARERRLLHAGDTVALAPKVLDTLIVLIQNAGSLLSKEELHRRLWPDTFVEDVTLARSISDLRAVLARYSELKYIETVPKHGYRFLGNVATTVSPDRGDDRHISDCGVRTGKGLMIAVLPFIPADEDMSVQIVGDGLAEEIVHALSRISGLMVAACGSSFRFRGVALDLRKIATELGTDLILRGTVKKVGSQFRIAVEMIETNRYTVRWSEHYVRELADLIHLQDSIASVIVGELRPRLAGVDPEIAIRRHSGLTEAWHALWEGRLHQNRFTAGSLDEAEKCFEKAISLDPAYALPHLGIAGNQFIKANLAHVRPSDVLARAADAVSEALRLESNSGEVHAAAGMSEVFWKYNWAIAESHFRLALALSPSSSSVHHLFALWWLRPQGRFKEALVENQLALDLDPLSPFLRVVQAYLLYLDGDDENALLLCDGAIRFEKQNFLAHRVVGHILQRQGKLTEANAAYARAVDLAGSSPVELGYFAISCALNGEMNKAREIQYQLRMLRAGSYFSSAIMALIDLCTDHETEAPLWIERAVKEHDPNLFTMATDPLWSSAKCSPQCEAALRDIGLLHSVQTSVASVRS